MPETKYTLHFDGLHGPFQGLHEAADQMVERWLAAGMAGDPKLLAHEGSLTRGLNTPEYETVMYRLIQRAEEHTGFSWEQAA